MMGKIKKCKYNNVLLNVGETELQDVYDSFKNPLWLDMSWFARSLHVLKQVSITDEQTKYNVRVFYLNTYYL